MERKALTRFFAQGLVELDGVVVKRGGGVVADRSGDLASGMPGRA